MKILEYVACLANGWLRTQAPLAVKSYAISAAGQGSSYFSQSL
jgi:hypothetical protein